MTLPNIILMTEQIISEEQKIWQLLEEVADPEIPVLSILDLGIVRDVVLRPSILGEGWEGAVTITPTIPGVPRWI